MSAALVEQAGQRALPVYLDVLDRTSLGAAVATVEQRWGRVDVPVNNGRYIGPGHMDLFSETPTLLLDSEMQANVMAPLILTRLMLDGMIERGSGIVINLTSGAGLSDPPSPVGGGGWGLGYGISKGALHRIAGLAGELGGKGVLFFNLDSGFIATERMAIDMAEFGFDASTGAPPDVIGAAVAWLVNAPEPAAMNGQVIYGQEVCRERGLLPGWS